MYLIEGLKQDILKAIQKASGEKALDVSVLEYPSDSANGDVAFPCFALAKQLKKAPHAIAEELAESIRLPKGAEKAEAKGPYLNFFLDRAFMYERTVAEAMKLDKAYGKRKAGKKEKVMVEYVSPNNNKPLHLGHIRNGLIGESVCNLLESQGHEAIRTFLLNDRGLAIAKSMVAYRHWGEDLTPSDKGVKGDVFVGDLYVQFDKEAKKDEALDEEAHEMIRKWEAGDEETRKLWKKLNDWVVAGQEESYKRLGFRFDAEYRESDIYKEGKAIVEEGLAKGVFEKDETGAVMARLEDVGLSDKVVLRADGTSLYITQDMTLAKRKEEDRHPDLSLIVVANEQNLHFRQLFAILKKLGYAWADKQKHLSYGYVSLPEGRMKSREGTVVEADELVSALEADAMMEIKQRHLGLDDRELERRSHILAMAALKFYFLEVDIVSDMTFDPKASLAFNGKTGPYLQYMNARIHSILRKSEVKAGKAQAPEAVTDDEHRLISQVLRYPEVVREAAEQLRPSHLANHLYETARALAGFYERVQVLAAPEKERAARINLISAVSIVLENGLDILGIQTLEEM